MRFATYAPRLVGTRAEGAGEMEEDDQSDQSDRHNDPEHQPPPWSATGRSAVGTPADVVGVGEAARVAHGCSLLSSSGLRDEGSRLSIHVVSVKPVRLGLSR